MNDIFQAVFLISLKRRPDRLTSALQTIRGCDWPFAEPTIFEAIDGNLVPCPEGWLAGGGAWGCRQSHVAILQRCIMEQVEPILILEDDITVRSSFAADCERFFAAVPDNWQILMLGGQHHSTPRCIQPGIVLCRNTQRTHAYAVRGRALRDLYALWASPKQVNHIDWNFCKVQREHPTYAPNPFLFGQSRSQSDINGRVNPAKFWQQPTGNEPVLLLNCDRETMEALREYCIHTGYDRGPDGIDNGLRKVFESNDVERKLRRWIDELQWECVSCEGMVLGVWHPNATLDLLRRCWRGPVEEVRTIEDTIAHLPGVGSWSPANAAESVLEN